MKIYSLLFTLILIQNCLAQFNFTNLKNEAITKSIQYTGNIVHAGQWIDNSGKNLVILTTTKKNQSINAPDDGYNDASLFVYHYIISDDSSKLTWKIHDFVKECPVDIILHFIDKSFAVTDLDKDGKAEVWIMYKVSCQGDVSPIPMKIIMYQGDKKFAVRGTTKVKLAAKEYMGGDFTFDNAFKNAPIEFRQYAEKLWNQNQVEKWGQ